jgi:hypothetical protein
MGGKRGENVDNSIVNLTILQPFVPHRKEFSPAAWHPGEAGKMSEIASLMACSFDEKSG